MSTIKHLHCLLIFAFFSPLAIYSEIIPRHIAAFWDSKVESIPENSLVHMTLEMPLNHLGLDVIYYDIRQPLPDIAHREDIRGVLLCFQNGTNAEDPIAFIDWVVDLMDRGKKLVIIGNSGFAANREGVYTSTEELDRIYQRLGFTDSEKWVTYPYDYKILSQSDAIYPFERSYPDPLPGFSVCKVYAPHAKSYLTLGVPGNLTTEADIIIIGRNGAYVPIFYANTFDMLLYVTDPVSLGWYFDPFRFFALAFDLGAFPIPDTTTMVGRRIFTTTCHGDYWNGPTLIEEYKGKKISCAEVILEKVVKSNPDIPMAIGVVAADIDPTWAGKPSSQEVVRKYFAQVNVEASSHTYSHPYDWEFFKTDAFNREVQFLHLYPYGSWQNSFVSWFRAKSYQWLKPAEFNRTVLKWGFATPRTYANEPFDLHKEIVGAAQYLNQFAPPHNKVELLIWSGDSRPWDKPVALAYQAGLKNYGGGFVQYDANHPSYLFVFPLGRRLEGLIQLYTGANGDNNYTNEWKEKFYAFQYLTGTLKNTESPRRVKPINLYFHSYSGEFQASVNAILSNIAFIRTQSPMAMQVRRYCDIGVGFYSVEFEPMGSGRWKVHNRQGLQTIRFENSSKYAVDFARCQGVIGCKEYQGVWYVHLDPFVKEPIVAIADRQSAAKPHEPYFIDSSWEVWDLKNDAGGVQFHTSGWGKLAMTLQMPSGGGYQFQVNDQPHKTLVVGSDNLLKIEEELPYNTEVKIILKPETNKQ